MFPWIFVYLHKKIEMQKKNVQIEIEPIGYGFDCVWKLQIGLIVLTCFWLYGGIFSVLFFVSENATAIVLIEKKSIV